MNKKNLVSLFVACIFLTLGISGILMYFAFREPGVKTTHILFGLLFIGIAVFHIINNWSSLVGYTRQRSDGKIRKEFLLSAGVIGLLVLGTALNFEPLAELAHFGEEIGRGERKPAKRIVFEEITTNEATGELALDILLQKSATATLPNVAIWVEDTSGNFVQNLFVPASEIRLLEEGENVRRILAEGEFELENLDPAKLKNWSAKASDKSSNFALATPTENFFLHTRTTAQPPFRVLVEINNDSQNEVYQATIDPRFSEAFRLKGNSQSLLANGLVEIH